MRIKWSGRGLAMSGQAAYTYKAPELEWIEEQ
jgi:hypothetical protein